MTRSAAMTAVSLCPACWTPLVDAIDSDPNGDMNATCARCRAEEEHDFDAEPGVTFNRYGDRNPTIQEARHDER